MRGRRSPIWPFCITKDARSRPPSYLSNSFKRRILRSSRLSEHELQSSNDKNRCQCSPDALVGQVAEAQLGGVEPTPPPRPNPDLHGAPVFLVARRGSSLSPPRLRPKLTP